MARLALCEPARSIIQRLGGETVVARELGLSRTTVWLWQVPGPRGRGGAIPRWNHGKLLQLARDKRVPLAEMDFHQSVESDIRQSA